MMQGSLFRAVLRLLTLADRELDFYADNSDDIDGDDDKFQFGPPVVYDARLFVSRSFASADLRR